VVRGRHAACVEQTVRKHMALRQLQDSGAPCELHRSARLHEAVRATGNTDVFFSRSPALTVVCLQNVCVGLASQEWRQLPAQVVCIGNARVTVARAKWALGMRCIPDEKQSPVAEIFHQHRAVRIRADPDEIEWAIVSQHGFDMCSRHFGLLEIAEWNSGAHYRLTMQQPAMAAEYKDVKVLALFTHGPGTIFNTKREFNTLGDLQQLKFRVADGVANEVGKLLGANVTIKPATETYELFSNRVMDGAGLPIESVAIYKLEKLVRSVATVLGGRPMAEHLAGAGYTLALHDAAPAHAQALMDALGGAHRAFDSLSALAAVSDIVTPCCPTARWCAMP
jgi:hypothetical protein